MNQKYNSNLFFWFFPALKVGSTPPCTPKVMHSMSLRDTNVESDIFVVFIELQVLDPRKFPLPLHDKEIQQFSI